MNDMKQDDGRHYGTYPAPIQADAHKIVSWDLCEMLNCIGRRTGLS